MSREYSYFDAKQCGVDDADEQLSKYYLTRLVYMAAFVAIIRFAAVAGRAQAISAVQPDGTTLLHRAVQNGNLLGTRLLIALGADVNQAKEDGSTALHMAAENGHKAVVELLLGKEDIDVNKGGKGGETPLFAAASRGHKAVVDILLKAGANTTQIWHQKLDSCPAATAVRDKIDDFIYYALENPVELDKFLNEDPWLVNAQKESGATTLYVFAQEGKVAEVTKLLEKGANVHKTMKQDGSTPLYIAAQQGHAEVVLALLEAGAATDQPMDNELTPLCVAAYNGREEAVKVLLEAGADVNGVSLSAPTPLSLAAQQGHAVVVSALLKAGANAAEIWHSDLDKCELAINLRKEIATPLYAAALKGNIAEVELLIAEGAIVDEGNNEGKTPLYVAALKGHEAVVKQLIAAGADANAGLADGCSPLLVAAAHGHEAVVELLEKAGGARVPREIAVTQGETVAREYKSDPGGEDAEVAGFKIGEVAGGEEAARLPMAAPLAAAGGAEAALSPTAETTTAIVKPIATRTVAAGGAEAAPARPAETAVGEGVIIGPGAPRFWQQRHQQQATLDPNHAATSMRFG
jgi:ankyrin repeat protein